MEGMDYEWGPMEITSEDPSEPSSLELALSMGDIPSLRGTLDLLGPEVAKALAVELIAFHGLEGALRMYEFDSRIVSIIAEAGRATDVNSPASLATAHG